MKAPLVFLPGLGADSRLFIFQQKEFKNILAPAWIPPKKNESLSHYAKRWARILNLKKGCVLVGVSFGGMVALEMAEWVQPRAIFLIGSCRSQESVPFYLRTLGGLWIWPYLGKTLAKLFPFGRGWFLGVYEAEQKNLLMKMFRESPNTFLRWTTQAIREWGGYRYSFKNIYHIHGDRDRLIPIQNVSPDEVVKGGGHTIILTHPKEVNAFIKNWVK